MFDDKYRSNIEERVFREGLELWEQSSKIVGVYCAFTPKEMISAAGAIPVSLCAGTGKPIEAAERHLPRNLCPLIKASYGHALSDTCPYFHSSDFLIADATCDGKKKMFELMAQIKPLLLLHLPQTYEAEASLRYWLEELYRLKDFIEEKTGNEITSESLIKEINLYNKLRKTVKDVFELNTGNIPLLFGREINIITDSLGFECNLEKRIQEMEDAMAEAVARNENNQFLMEMRHRPRIMITGCPITNKKVLNIVEESGGVVVAMENCGGLKTVGSPVREEEADPMMALAEKYLNTACSCMTPNNKRFAIIENIMKDYRIEGVVELVWEACHTYNVEANQTKEFVTGVHGIPYIRIWTDYSVNDTGQIRTRIQAFLEMIHEVSTLRT